MAEAEKRESDGILERLFHLREKGTTPRQEMLAGLTTFVAVSYIIFVNPHMLADAGMPQEAAIASTILATVFATAIMGLWANFPVAVAPGMGLNAFFAYYVCTTVGLHWTVALGAVFISGVVFFLLTVTKIRQMLIDAVPLALKSAIVVGIGMFIAFIGMKNAGIVVADKATFVTLGHMLKPEPLLTCFGLILTAVLMAHNVKGAMIIGIFCTTLAAMAVGVAPVPHGIENIVSLSIPDIRPVFFALDIRGAIDYGIVSIVLTFTIVELFDNMGTLIGLSRKAGLMRDDGHIENIDRALLTDSVGTMASSLFGTSTVTSYVESAAGIAQGGRTGLTAVTVAVLFRRIPDLLAPGQPRAALRHGACPDHRGRPHDERRRPHQFQRLHRRRARFPDHHHDAPHLQHRERLRLRFRELRLHQALHGQGKGSESFHVVHHAALPGELRHARLKENIHVPYRKSDRERAWG